MVIIAKNLEEAKFISRENRFVGIIEINGRKEKCHILNPGRMIKFLIPGAQVLVENRASPKRKLAYSLLYVKLPQTLILIDSIVPNAIVEEALQQNKVKELIPITEIKREVPYGTNHKSRIDFLLNNRIYLEVKATNYVEDEIGYFPDAPTLRGQKHLEELIKLKKELPDSECVVLFLGQREDIKKIKPFDKIDPEFGKLLRKASKQGVQLLGYGIEFSNGGKTAEIGSSLSVVLD